MSKLSDIEVIAKQAAWEVLTKFKKEQKEKHKKSVLHNTETLLNNYLEIEYFFQNCEDSESIGNEEIVVKSLRASKRATLLLYVHAAKCFERLAKQEPDKYKVIYYLYLDEELQALRWEERLFRIEDKLNISRRTLYNWRGDMVEKLSIMLFGADGYMVLAI